jgi:hypothetical protein
MSAWQAILFCFGGDFALLAVLGFAGKSLFETIINRDTKRFESELTAKANATIEQVKNDLQLKAIEHQVRFTRLHEKSAETITEAYSLLQSYLQAVDDYVKILEPRGGLTKPERRERVNLALKDFRSYFGKRQIFLPKETAMRMRDLDNKLYDLAHHFAMTIEGQEETASPTNWMQAVTAVNDDIPPLLVLLEDEFRELLGQSKI